MIQLLENMYCLKNKNYQVKKLDVLFDIFFYAY